MSFKERLKEVFLDVPAEKRGEFKDAFNSAMSDVETPTTEETTSKFIDATLSDGTPIMIEPAVEVGAAVTVAADGEIVPVEDASHELADGTVIVTVGGLITEVIMPEGEVVTEEVMETETPTPAAVPSPKTVIERTEVERKFAEAKEEYESKIKELTEANEKLASEFNAYKNESKEFNNNVLEAIEVLMDFSADKPTQAPKTSVGKVATLNGIKAAFRKYKK
jgi:hypothetical protein